MMRPESDLTTPNTREADCMQRSSDEGGNLVEYALVLVLIVIVVIAVYLLVEPAIGNIISGLRTAP
jgi:Flp pilus assembly pilin Flp